MAFMMCLGIICRIALVELDTVLRSDYSIDDNSSDDDKDDGSIECIEFDVAIDGHRRIFEDRRACSSWFAVAGKSNDQHRTTAAYI